ncbi:hypothetical protein XELAEV_18041004mg [Xenopus laevis]|uniref:Uncharacterized protein n=1 Tax=Xenopus laevis TaxID=8355 RepID=A0A974C1D3_XENLA|nr:hypothetical protein XELAEV_18041004mg [Xenopus laevis]
MAYAFVQNSCRFYYYKKACVHVHIIFICYGHQLDSKIPQIMLLFINQLGGGVWAQSFTSADSRKEPVPSPLQVFYTPTGLPPDPNCPIPKH